MVISQLRTAVVENRRRTANRRTSPCRNQEPVMPYVIGVVLGILTVLIGRLAGFDRDRVFYPTIMVVIAWYYVLFGVMGGETHALVIESIVMMVFSCIAIVGFRSNLWLVAAALAGHGVFDLVHNWLVTNPGVPTWWPTFCFTIDVLLGVFLGWLLRRGTLRARELRSASTGA